MSTETEGAQQTGGATISDKRRYRLIHVGPPTYFLLLMQTALSAWSFWYLPRSPGETIWTEFVGWAVASATIILLVQVVYLLFRRPVVVRLASFALVLAFSSLFLIHVCGEQQLDFFLIGDNFREIFFSHSADSVLSRLSTEQTVLFVDVVLLGAALAFFTNYFVVWPTPRWHRGQLIATALALLVIVATPWYRHNDLTYFARTASDYAFGRFTYPGVTSTEQYPYVQRAPLTSPAKEQHKPSPRPHVFLLMLESFNWSFVEKRTPEGSEYTPTFNALIDKGVYVERFYGNSIQTCRGQTSVLCSILDGMHGKLFSSYPELRLRSIAEILRDQGYRTVFCQSQRSLEYDNTGAFLLHNGFDEAYAMDDAMIGPEERPYVWGWGLQDDYAFKELFKLLDAPRGDAERRRPLFVTFATASHHWPFDGMPPSQRDLYPSPRDGRERFANSIHLADRYLSEFFNQLNARPDLAENSLVLVTGDHSFPAGEHNGYYNEQGFYEENFRIPLLMLWKGHLDPRRIREGTFSQLDIAPTLLDLLAISTDHHFQGCSMLAEPSSKRRAVPMIQPYDGTYICIVRFPLKYVQGVRVPGEYLFNLELDPKESQNLLDQYDDSEELKEFREDVRQVYFNQHLIQHDRIWPDDD